ncbi:MAG: hypothetical protein K6T75_10425 [Acetobacteraceae bacterium]|nr:hypothetical protein [Acetobacteraceae bacterium]
MSKAAARAKAREYEAVIGRIRDVVSARVVTDDGGEPTEIHVLARDRRGAKNIARDVESALLTRFGRPVDPSRVIVAQIHEASESGLLPVRLALRGVSVGRFGNRTEARVVLEAEESTFEGVVSGAGSSTNAARLVASATLAAVERQFQATGLFSLDDVAFVALGERRAAVVGITAVGGGAEQHFIGSCFVRRDEWDAVCRATLDAVNRQLDLLMKKKAWTGGDSPLTDPDFSGA